MLQASYNTDSMEDIPPAFVSVHVKLALLNINCNDKMKPFLQTTEKREMVHCLKNCKIALMDRDKSTAKLEAAELRKRHLKALLARLNAVKIELRYPGSG